MKKERITLEFRRYGAGEIPAADRDVARAATSATELAYAPYSDFRVGAAARLADGRLVRAANLENAAFPQCLCAEASLLGTVHTQYPGARIDTVAVAVHAPSARTEVAAPCGSCRQQLYEAEQRQGTPIRLLLILADGGLVEIDSVSALLPLGFRLVTDPLEDRVPEHAQPGV